MIIASCVQIHFTWLFLFLPLRKPWVCRVQDTLSKARFTLGKREKASRQTDICREPTRGTLGKRLSCMQRREKGQNKVTIASQDIFCAKSCCYADGGIRTGTSPLAWSFLHYTTHSCMHTQFSFSSYYTTSSVNCFFEALSVLKLKCCKLQSFYNFHFEPNFLLTIWFQIKKFQTTKFHNLSGSTTFIWMFLHLRSFGKFKFSNLKNSDILFRDKSDSN
jgi:hypothetical protein